MGEAINLINNFKVEKVIFNCGPHNDLEQELIKVLDKKKIPYYSCIKELNIDDNKLYFLNNKDYGNENDNSNVIYTELDGYKFMFMGDAGVEVEEDLIKKYNLKDIDILKDGHHGSKTSSGKKFIYKINPKYSIISVGKNNRYGHPNIEVLNNLDNATSHTDFTDQNGIVKFDNLNLGLYLVKQTKGVNGYSNFDSFLVALPKVEDNVWVYDIKAKPKTDIYKVVDITIFKKWNSHNKDIPSEVTIELYNDLQLIETVTLNNDNNWTFTFKNLKLSDKYNVKEVNIPKGYTPSYKVDGYSFTVTNTDTLAKTGQIFYPIIIFFVLGISLILVGLIAIKSEA